MLLWSLSAREGALGPRPAATRVSVLPVVPSFLSVSLTDHQSGWCGKECQHFGLGGKSGVPGCACFSR